MIHLHNPEGSGRTGRNKISFLYNPSPAFPYLSKNDSDPSLPPSLLPCCIVLTSDGTFWPQATPACLLFLCSGMIHFGTNPAPFHFLGLSRGDEPIPASFSRSIQTLLNRLSTNEWWHSEWEHGEIWQQRRWPEGQITLSQPWRSAKEGQLTQQSQGHLKITSPNVTATHILNPSRYLMYLFKI